MLLKVYLLTGQIFDIELSPANIPSAPKGDFWEVQGTKGVSWLFNWSQVIRAEIIRMG